MNHINFVFVLFLGVGLSVAQIPGGETIPETTDGMRCDGSSPDCCSTNETCGWMEGGCQSDDQCNKGFKCADSPNCLTNLAQLCCYWPGPSSSGKVNFLSWRERRELIKLVNDRIDAGVCDEVQTLYRYEGGRCEDDARHFFTTYIRWVNGVRRRVMISSGIPNYPAGQDTLNYLSPFRRCETWRFVVMPVDPEKTEGEGKRMFMASVGNAISGGHLYSDLARPDGTLAVAEEADNLDGCFAHASPSREYHHHYNLACSYSPSTRGADDPRRCKHIGYNYDGVPVFGFCRGMTSCYKINDGEVEKPVNHTSGILYAAENSSQYHYDEDAYNRGECTLDKANGGYLPPRHGRKKPLYAYFMTDKYPFVPIWFMGAEGEQSTCSAYGGVFPTRQGGGMMSSTPTPK